MSTSRTSHHEMAGVEGTNTATPRSSSSPELSSPPHSLSDPGSPAAQQLTSEHRNAQISAFAVNTFGVEAQQPPARKKPGRKPGSLNKPKVNPDGSSATNTDSKPKRTRKPRDPNAPPIQRRKRTVTMPDVTLMPNPKPAPSVAAKQTKLSDISLQPSDATFNVHPPKQSPDAPILSTSQIGKTEDIPRPINSFFNPAPPAPSTQAPVRTSGQNYDPIRSNYDPVRETVVNNHSPYNNSQMSPKYNQMPNRASASPSISSLVDPPHQVSTSPSIAAQSFFSHQMKMQNHEGHHSVPPSPTSNRPAPSPLMNTINSAPPQIAPNVERQPESWAKASVPAHFTLSNSPVAAPAPAPTTITMKKTTPNTAMSTASSAAPSPKPPKPIDVTPPPLPGSANGLFGPKDGTESRAPTIILHIPMNGETNKYVNFSRLAEERYGWEALHPRLAAQRERLARVAAAGAALEKNSTHKESGDEMSLDISEGEGDGSNVEMGGMSDGRTGTDGGKKPTKKRKMKEDEYDKDDGFVDDSEMLWEEQAAASKDGFFVYSGPLVPEGEKPQFDKTEGVTKRGRGGRGRGVTRGTTSTRGGATGGGPGSRGGNVTRKPRITKADRAKMDQEKAEREKLGALAAKSSGYGGMSQLASAASMGGTPMVFNQ